MMNLAGSVSAEHIIASWLFFSDTDLLTLIRVAKTENVSLLNYERCGRGGKGARRSKTHREFLP